MNANLKHMYRLGKYTAYDTMSDLVSRHYRILLVMSRFGIGLGFDDKTIGEVCEENGVDVDTFLIIVNMLLDVDDITEFTVAHVSIEALVSYLHNSHDYFLGFRLPGIRTKLTDVLGGTSDDLSKAIIHYFDEYVSEVRKHMMYEEDIVFPYVRELLSGHKHHEYNITIFQKQHDQVEARLTEFKQILIKYYPSRSTNEINSVLFDIFNCENDLASHNAIEDRLFVPAIKELENKCCD